LGHLAFAAGAYVWYGQFAAPAKKWPKKDQKWPKNGQKMPKKLPPDEPFLPHHQHEWFCRTVQQPKPSLPQWHHCHKCIMATIMPIRTGKVKAIPGGGSVADYKEVNRLESIQLADAFLSYRSDPTNGISRYVQMVFADMYKWYLPICTNGICRYVQMVFVARFLEGQEQFLKSKGKSATVFTVLKLTRSLWSRLL
jgi:hypothetical protein